MSAPLLEPGRIVGQRYTVRRLVARGQSSSLYEAITAPSREILLEVFASDTAVAPNVEARLERLAAEVNALPAGIVLPIVEAAVDRETGCPFIASEASATPALAELVKLCPLASEELVAFVARLCAALDAAHARGLLHVALDPTKVFVGPAPRCDVRLAGLGTAFLRGHVCDPVWSAPEAYAPAPTADVYSAALLTVFAARGELPSDPASLVSAIARDIVTTGPPEASLDRRLAVPLSRALAPAASERHASPGDFARAIADALGSAFVVSSAWRAAPATAAAEPSDGQALPPPLPPPLPPAATSLVALTTPVALPAPHVAQEGSPRPLLGSRAKTILVIAAAFVPLVVGLVMILRVVGDTPKGTAVPVASTKVASPAVTAPAPAPVPVPAPIAAPVEDAPPSPPKEPTLARSGEATLIVECTPECQSITVDGSPVESPAALKPGAHVVVVKRGLHGPQTKYVKLTAGRQTTISFIWWKTPPGPPKAGGGKKPCGKFLQRCD